MSWHSHHIVWKPLLRLWPHLSQWRHGWCWSLVSLKSKTAALTSLIGLWQVPVVFHIKRLFYALCRVCCESEFKEPTINTTQERTESGERERERTRIRHSEFLASTQHLTKCTVSFHLGLTSPWITTVSPRAFCEVEMIHSYNNFQRQKLKFVFLYFKILYCRL